MRSTKLVSIYENLSHQELYSAIIGMVLGDFNLQIHGINARIQAAHTPAVRDYVAIKGIILSQIPGIIFSVRDIVHNNRKLGKLYPQIRIRTNTHSFLTEIRKEIYNPHKRVTLELLERLTPMGLALWYMDDGNLELHYNKVRFKPDFYRERRERSIGGRNIRLSTHSFSLAENEIICTWLRFRWGILAQTKPSKGLFFIHINTTNAKKFIDLVRPFVLEVPSMYHKIDFKYRDLSFEHQRFNIEYWISQTKEINNVRDKRL